MAITRMSNLGIASLGSEKYNDILAGLPGVMPAPTAADGGTGTSATVSFSAVAGTTSYTAISNPGNLTGTATSSPVTVSGLTSGTAYTFQIRGNNSAGAGAYSAASNSITPVVPTAYFSIATVLVASPAATITFSSIPQTYKHLQIRAYFRDATVSANSTNFVMKWNGATSDFSYTNMSSNGINAPTGTGYNTGNITSEQVVPTNFYGYWGAGVIDIHNYSDTDTCKTAVMQLGTVRSASDANTNRVSLDMGTWNNTNALTSLVFNCTSGAGWDTGTQFALYGIKGA
jgi:hypothetical protein